MSWWSIKIPLTASIGKRRFRDGLQLRSVRSPEVRVLITASVCLLSAGVSLAQKPISVAVRLDAEFKNQEFVTKVSLWNVLRVTEGGGNDPMLVDTEIYPNKAKRAELRAASADSPSDIAPDYIPNARGFLHSLPEGSRVVVTKVDAKDDRLELWLRSVPGRAYAKLKLMYGKGWQKSVDYEQVIALVAEGLRIERVEQRRALEAEYQQLQSKATVDRTAISRQAASVQLERSRQLRDTLQRLLKNRTDYERLTSTSTKKESDEYSRALADVEPNIKQLDEEVRHDQIREAQLRLTNASQEAAKLREQVSRPPRTVAELEKQQQALKAWEESLGSQRELHATLASLGETVPAADVTGLQQEADSIRTRRAELAQGRGALELNELGVEYRELERKRAQLLDAYTRAFGTAKQRELAGQLASHLQRMYDNRIAAQKLGLASAQAQAAEIQRMSQRIRR